MQLYLSRQTCLWTRPHPLALPLRIEPQRRCAVVLKAGGEPTGPPSAWHKLHMVGSTALLASSLLLCGPGWLHTPAVLAVPDVGRASVTDRSTFATIQRPSTMEQLQLQQQQQQQQEREALQARMSYHEPLSDISSEVEDKLLEVVRQMETGVGGVIDQIMPSMPGSRPASQEEADAIDASAHKLIQEVWEVVNDNYLDARSSGWDRSRWAQLRDEALARRYSDTIMVHRTIREMITYGLKDPYCRFIQPSELQSMKKYDVTGVGLNLGTAEEYLMKTNRPLPSDRLSEPSSIFVVGLSRNSPADQGGMEQGDQLLEVDGASLKDKTPFQVASAIAGADQSASNESQPRPFVDIKVKKLDGSIADVRLDRPVKQISSPVSSSLGVFNNEPVGMIRLTSFNARAQRDLAAAIRGLEERGAKSLVLDLRDNRGGLVSEGLEVAKLFLEDSAPLVYTESRSIPKDAPRAQSPALTQLPLTVLVNEHTASASEIVAGALQDNCRAILVGNRTYGKGLIQSVYELSDGSGMVLTVGKYLTPKQTDIDRSGIQPDFRSNPNSQAAATALQACRVPGQAS